MDERVDHRQSIQTTEYYVTLKRKQVLKRATAWMGPEGSTLSETSRSQEDTRCTIPPLGVT